MMRGSTVVVKRMKETMSRSLVCALTAALASLAGGSTMAAEGAMSHYLPGLAGDIAIAQSPAPGLQVANTVFFQSGDIGTAVLQGQVNLGLDVDLVLSLAAASYTFDAPAIGGTYTIAAVVPFGHAELEARLTGPAGGRFNASEDSFNVSDIFIIPLQFNWNRGDFHVKFAQSVVAPSGAYDLDNVVNLGRNYWSFDTAAAVTWLKPETGTEISVQPGIMFNTENSKTNYKTGTEFHMDFVINQFVSKTIAIGLRGYWYNQVTGDSGSGAVLGDFESEGVAIGPGFMWTPKFAAGKLTVLGKWLHDVKATHRFDSDYGTVTAAWKF